MCGAAHRTAFAKKRLKHVRRARKLLVFTRTTWRLATRFDDSRETKPGQPRSIQPQTATLVNIPRDCPIRLSLLIRHSEVIWIASYPFGRDNRHSFSDQADDRPNGVMPSQKAPRRIGLARLLR